MRVRLRVRPRYVDTTTCIACGACARVCPVRVPDPFDAGLSRRRAAHILYDQTVPLRYAIDGEKCLFLTRGKCRKCVEACPADAIAFDQKTEERILHVGAVVLAPGAGVFDPVKYDSYAHARIPDVVTSLEYERMLSSSGPCKGHVVRPSDSTEPRRVAWLQCVGSRAVNRCDNPYCSSVCCMYALKQALVSREHGGEGCEQTLFFMDIRTPGKGYERYMEGARAKGVRLLKARPHSFLPGREGRGVEVTWADDEGRAVSETFDLVVMSVGLETPEGAPELAAGAGVTLDPWGFAEAPSLDPCATSRPGVFACGAFREPKSIAASVTDGSAAACGAASLLAGLARDGAGRAAGSVTGAGGEVPAGRDAAGDVAGHVAGTAADTAAARQTASVSASLPGDAPRVGVFVCSCGNNIAGVVDVKALADFAANLPYVVHVENNLFSCSQDTQTLITRAIRAHRLNRVVVAACTPRTHEPLFRETLQAAGLNQHLLVMANIRNHCTWIHGTAPADAYDKARDLVRMAVAGVVRQRPLPEVRVPVTPVALVAGGGASGMCAALEVARQGFAVHLVERDEMLGGNARALRVSGGQPVAPWLDALEAEVRAEPGITLHMGAALREVHGFVGNFTTGIDTPDGPRDIAHGVAIIATGARAHVPAVFGYGTHPRIMTHLDIDRAFVSGALDPASLGTAVFIQCVGSREAEHPWCSRVCCTHTVETALHILDANPAAQVFVLYRDMRTYGMRELLYKQAREKGAIFVRFEPENPPRVAVRDGRVVVVVRDHVLRRDLELDADLLGLATGVEPGDNATLSGLFGAPLDGEGWFAEAHAKLRPVDTVADGVFIAGLAHAPRPLDESLAQARAAAVRACALLRHDELVRPGEVAVIDRRRCVGCGVCWHVCPFGAIEPDGEGVAVVTPALCKGCGLCVAACRSSAPELGGFATRDVMAQVAALFA